MSVSKACLGKPLSDKSVQFDELKQEAIKLCGWGKETFPGSQPVSLTRRNLVQIARTPYVVCEKSDGERFMLLHFKGASYVFDRRFNFHKITLSSVFGSSDTTTLLDGELVEDEVKGVRYLVYDAVTIDGQSVRELPLLRRLEGVLKKVLSVKESKSDTFPVFVKDFFDVKHSSFVVNLSRRLPHYSDGLIFTPARDPYLPGTCHKLLKWKPKELNTIDFVLELVMGITTAQFHGKLLSAEAGVQTFKGVWLAREGPMWQWLCDNTHRANGRVVECGWDPNIHTFVPTSKVEYVEEGYWTDGGWVLHRIREDRSTPNDVNVVEKVKASIADGLSLDDVHSVLANVESISKRSSNNHKRHRTS